MGIEIKKDFRTNYLLDTNILLNGFEEFLHEHSNCGVIISGISLAELDKIKSQTNEAGHKARIAIQKIFELKNLGNLNNWLLIDQNKNISLKVELEYSHQAYSKHTTNDDLLLKVLEYSNTNYGFTILCTNDINLSIKAEALSFTSKQFIPNPDLLKYTGHIELYVDDAVIDLVHRLSKLSIIKNVRDTGSSSKTWAEFDYSTNTISTEQDLYENQCITLISTSNIKKQALTIYKKGFVNKLRFGEGKVLGNISAKNRQQKYFFEILMDDSIKIVAVNAKLGSGKAQPLHSKILTPKGFTTMGEIKVGDKVFGRDGLPTTVTNIFPQGIKENYRITFQDGRTVECCDEHLWTYSTTYQKNKNRETTNSLKYIIEQYKYNTDNPSHIWIKNTMPIQYEEKEYEIDPYLLGLLLGDGYLPKVGSTCMSTSEPDIIEKITKLLPSGFTIKKQKGDNYSYPIVSIDGINYKRSTRHVKDMFEDLGLLGLKSHEKFIPEQYLRGSVEQRLSLLKGLIDTDGSTDTKFRIRYSTTSESLKNNIIELCNSLGIQVRTRVDSREGRRDCYDINLITNQVVFSSNKHMEKYNVYLQNLPNLKGTHKNTHVKITNIEHIGQCEMQCITVDNQDHIYITDGHIPTHNSYAATAVGLEKTMEQNIYDKILYVKPLEAMGGKDIGFLPDDKNSKLLQGYAGTINNILENIFAKSEKQTKNSNSQNQLSNAEYLLQKGLLSVEAPTFMRGMSYYKTYIIIDEASNISQTDIKNLLGRCGELSKVIIIGDSDQIDNPNLNSSQNGLTYAINKLKGSELFATILLDRSVRSDVAQTVADRL